MYIMNITGTCFLQEVLVLWDGTHPSLPLPQSRSVKKRWGSKVVSDSSTPVNRMMIVDHSLKGY